jgi:hypothetical protein
VVAITKTNRKTLILEIGKDAFLRICEFICSILND